MTTTTTTTPSPTLHPDRTEALLTGLWYLGLGITGMLSFLLIRARLYEEGDPAGTLENLLAHDAMARAGIGLELGVVVFQALAALWFYRLFRSIDAFAAGAVAVFGLVNAIMILASAAFLAAALATALEPVTDTEGTPHLMYLVSGEMWGVGAVFFGLWLIPMGLLVLRSRWAPRVLGWFLVAGGVGYVLSAFTSYLLADAGWVAEALTVPATVGELWMIGWLVRTGLRPQRVERPQQHGATT